MKKLLIISAVGFALSFIFAGQLLSAKTYTFSNPGQKVPTQNDIEERRINTIVESINAVSQNIDALNKTQQITNEQIKQLLQMSYSSQQYLKMLAAGAQEENKKGAPTQTDRMMIDPQKAALAELTRVTKEQNETLKLLATVMGQIASEQKITNNLLEAFLRNDR